MKCEGLTTGKDRNGPNEEGRWPSLHGEISAYGVDWWALGFEG